MSGTRSSAGPRLPDVDEFCITAPLPQDETMVLEASAGTGKTYTIASLAARYLAEGVVRLENLMLVTFGRMATQELRDRVRGRLVAIEEALAHPTVAAAGTDRVASLLATGTAQQVRARRRRLAAALASFDEATIATTHSFCLRMLAGLGIAADAEPDTALLEDPRDLLRQLTDDIYLRRYRDLPADRRPFGRRTAHIIADDAVNTVPAQLVPTDAPERSTGGERVDFAAEVRAEFDLRKRRARRYDFDDLQNRLADALDDPHRGEAAKATLRSAYHVVLVDEFQDTDPVQWQILQRAFHGHRTLILIGDPKQAIYAFRGADVYTYLRAADTAERRETLGTNWRSDARLVDALGHLWGGLTLGDPGILIREVHAQHQGSRLSVPDSDATVRIRQLGRHQAEQTKTGYVKAPSAVTAVAADVACEVVHLLQSGATITPRDGEPRPLHPDDIAVLVNTNAQGEQVRDALRDKNVPVVLAGNTSVFASEAAGDWMTLLEALEAPNRTAKVRAAALTPFLGWSADRLATCGPADQDRLIDRLRGWADRFVAGGMAALLDAVTVQGGVGARVLGRPDGDRRLTDIRHVAHALHTVARTEHLGPSALLEWLRRRIDDSGVDETDEVSRRLSSEQAAVAVYTVHKSKGLEFGVVLVPFAWNRWMPDAEQITTMRLHDEYGQPVLDVGGPGTPGYPDRLARHRAEELGGDLRELYVALTRARSLVLAWWAPGWNARCSPLTRMLLADPDPDGGLPAEVEFGTDAEVLAALQQRAAPAGGLIAVERADPGRTHEYRPPHVDPARLTAGVFDRQLDTEWRRTSYSSLTAEAHAAHYEGILGADGGTPVPVPRVDSGSEPEDPGTVDEPAVPVAGMSRPGGLGAPGAERSADNAEDAEGLLRAVPSPLDDFPAGTAFGSVVHDVLEYLDTSAVDLPGQLAAHCERVLGESSGDIDPVRLAAALGPVFATPLGAAAAERTLADIAPADRLAEMAFELPLAGGDDPHAHATVADLADVFADNTDPGDPLAGYPERLRDRLIADGALRGYLNGSLDAVLRIRVGGEPRFLVVDYKTNRLGSPSEPLTAWDYRPAAMAEAMMGAHYPLQALLYQVALHRYLRWRLPGYRPETHLGGALYLFVRGMTGPDTPRVDGQPCGVFTWQPTVRLIEQASEVLAAAPDATPAGVAGRR